MICVLFRVLKRWGGSRGGVAYRYKLCDTPNEAKVPFLKNQIEDAR